MRLVLVSVTVALVLGSSGYVFGSVPTEVVPGVDVDGLEHFDLPEHFRELIADRKLIDKYQQAQYRTEAAQGPAPQTSINVRHRNPRYVRTIVPEHSPEVLDYRRELPDSFVPLRSYRAPILDRTNELTEAVLRGGASAKRIAAAEFIVRRLAYDGLLPTLARVIDILGPEAVIDNPKEALATLNEVGFPTDLLACFGEGGKTEPTELASGIARKLQGGAKPEQLKDELTALPFRFVRAAPNFRAATESGEWEPGLFRMQADGGYRDGIVPGGSVDVICQVVAAQPQVDSLISLRGEHIEAFQWMARNWKLRRTNHVTLIAEPLPVGAWAQDNGKAGYIEAAGGTRKVATLTPRFASQDEGKSNLKKGESFLMDGLRAAGHEVIHSLLLFQGGNLLAVRDPKTGERILLIGEGTVYRNKALGLSNEQILEAFRLEFGVDRCVMLPAVSYHLDFDVTVRANSEGVVAFANDADAAVREIVGTGINALERCGVLPVDAAAKARADLAGQNHEALLRRLSEVVRTGRNKTNALPKSLANCFVADGNDSAPGNLQTFLLAVDTLASGLPATEASAESGERTEYLQALRRMRERGKGQIARLRGLGWTVVTIPSMPDLFRSINYLNGIHHRGGYMLPIVGGLYGGLDRLAGSRFQQILGPDARIQPIRTADCQRHHGGVHCTVAAYPKW